MQIQRISFSVGIEPGSARRARDEERADEEALRDRWFSLLREEAKDTEKEADGPRKKTVDAEPARV